MIIVFSHAHPSISKGGAEVSAYTLFKGLRQLGYPAAFVAMCPEDQLSQVRFETTDEYVLPFNPADYDHFFHVADPGLLHLATQRVALLQPTALIFHHFLFLGINTIQHLAEHFKVPSILVLHEFLAICHHHGQMVTRPAKRLCSEASPTRCASCFPEFSPEELHVRKQNFKQAMQTMHCLVSPSQFLADRFVAWGVEPTKIAVVENGLAGYEPPAEVTISSPKPKVNRTAKKILAAATPKPRGRRVIFGYFGQINPFKGIDQILDAVDVLRKDTNALERICVRVHGNVVGVTDDFKTRFEAACAKGGSVEYLGPYNNADVQELMLECDYVLMASKWWENSPVVIQEAYAAQRPVIAPGFGGMAEKVVDGVTGNHFKPNDPADLARLMLECVQLVDGGSAPYQIPQPYTAKDMANSYLNRLAIEQPLLSHS